jgi:hypothetical protein
LGGGKTGLPVTQRERPLHVRAWWQIHLQDPIPKPRLFRDNPAMSVNEETIGRVLDSFQHVIERLESHRQEQVSDKFDVSQLDDLAKTFVLEKTMFEESTVTLLSDNYNSAELKILLDDPKGDRWRTEYLRNSAKKRFGQQRDECLGLVAVITRILDEFQQELKSIASKVS